MGNQEGNKRKRKSSLAMNQEKWRGRRKGGCESRRRRWFGHLSSDVRTPSDSGSGMVAVDHFFQGDPDLKRTRLQRTAKNHKKKEGLPNCAVSKRRTLQEQKHRASRVHKTHCQILVNVLNRILQTEIHVLFQGEPMFIFCLSYRIPVLPVSTIASIQGKSTRRNKTNKHGYLLYR